MAINTIIVLTIIGILLFFLIREIGKYSNLKSSYEIRTYINGYVTVQVNHDFNYKKLYPLIITEVKKAIEDGKRLKLGVRFRYCEYEWHQISLDSKLTNNEQDCTNFIEGVKTIIERKLYNICNE